MQAFVSGAGQCYVKSDRNHNRHPKFQKLSMLINKEIGFYKPLNFK